MIRHPESVGKRSQLQNIVCLPMCLMTDGQVLWCDSLIAQECYSEARAAVEANGVRQELTKRWATVRGTAPEANCTLTVSEQR